MSGWYDRAKAFVAGTPAKAADLEAELDNIAAAFNGLFAASRVPALEDLALAETAKDVPGASVTLAPKQASLLIVNAVFDLRAGESALGAVGLLNVDGADQAPQALGPLNGSRATAEQTFCVELNAASHTIKLRAKVNVAVGTNKCTAANTGFTYLLTPNPEP